MKFEDINTNELRELGILPIPYFKQLKLWVSVGYADKIQYDGRCRIYPISWCGDLEYEPSSNFMYEITNKERKTISSFEEIKEEEFEWLGFKGKALAKLLWLQKYLKGEVSGTYNKEEDENLIKISVRKAVAKEEQKINKLKERIMIMSDEIAELKDENKRLKNEIKTYEKVKKVIKEISKIDL